MNSFIFRPYYLLFFVISLIPELAIATITAANDAWSSVGNVQIRVRYDDADNGDGVGDGAISVNGQDTVFPIWLTYTFQGTISSGESFSIQTNIYNYRSSFVQYRVELYNLTDNALLATSPTINIQGFVTAPVTTSLDYTSVSTDAGDTLQLRFVLDDQYPSTARAFAVDNVTFNGTLLPVFDQMFLPKPVIDILPVIPTPTETLEMDSILAGMSDLMLGDSAPSQQELDDAIAEYNSQNIVVNGEAISGAAHTTTTSWKEASYLKTLVLHQKSNPGDSVNLVRIINTVWLFSHQFYTAVLPWDHRMYFYKKFAAPAVFVMPYLNTKQKSLFYYSLYRHSYKMIYYWSPTYDYGQPPTLAIDMDEVGNLSSILLVFGLLQSGTEETLQWTKAFNRYYERFMSYSPGISDSIKSDGSAFHHASALNNYAYNFNTPMKILSILKNTSFQVSDAAYKILRKAVYTQIFLTNDNVEALSMSGRHPEARHIDLNKNDVASLAMTGGNILNLAGPDPALAGAYVRQWGSHQDLPGVAAESLSGFSQFNYHTAGAYWHNNWLAVARGQTNWGFGAEISSLNYYGRYQSYGALEIIYPGGQITGNGFKYNGWNWNYNPGATSIVLPWNLLRSENLQQREYQSNGFTGSSSLNKKNNLALNETHGEVGVFAMDFLESTDNAGSTPLGGPNTHNPSFAFKKSVFFFDDYILSLASNIKNDDNLHPTVTTLYQRLSETNANVTVNDNNYATFGTTVFSGATDNWLIDNFDTGYYVVSGGNDLKIQRENQQTPDYNKLDYTLTSTADYSIGYIDHGTTPVNAGYEYLIKPNTTSADMNALAVLMSDTQTQPYTIHQKNVDAHIVSDLNNNISAYALFSANSSLPSELLLNSNSLPCLVMYQEVNPDNITLSITNPDLGFERGGFDFSVVVTVRLTIKGNWLLANPYTDVTIISSNNAQTVLDFSTYDGLPIEINLTKITDSDGDGLSDLFELSIGTSVLLVDTDSDGVSDFDEVAYDGDSNSYIPGLDLNPNLVDTDGDGINDLSDPFPLAPADGDINDDGSVNVVDVLLIQRHLLGEIDLTSAQQGRADVAPLLAGVPASNGQLDLGDMLVIQRKVLKLISF